MWPPEILLKRHCYSGDRKPEHVFGRVTAAGAVGVTVVVNPGMDEVGWC